MKDCRRCTHPGRDCIPYLMTLSQEDTMAWCAVRKKALHLSNDDIADRSGIPKSTVDRIFSPHTTDCRFTTMQPIVCVLSGCKAEDLDCDSIENPTEALVEQVKAKEEIIKHLEEENNRKNGVIDHLHATAKEDIERAKEEESESIAYMKQKEKVYVRTIYTLGIVSILTLVVILGALIIDRSNKNMGFFWLDNQPEIIYITPEPNKAPLE